MKFIVDRSKWKNAKHGYGNTALLNSAGFQCCLGFCEAQLGITQADLLYIYIGGPCGLFQRNPRLKSDDIFVQMTEECVIVNTHLTNRAIAVNDDGTLTDEQREKTLQQYFLEAGHEIEFIGEFQD